MNTADRALAIAARIADGSAIDWPDAEASPPEPVDPAILEELRAIAALATLHRAPTDWLDREAAPAGTRWGPLTLLAPVGQGRFGHVHRAWDARLQRQVALKLLHAPSSVASHSSTRAIDEARLLARVRHPNVLTVHGAECLDNQVGIWTEFIEGHTLAAVLADRGPLPADDVVSLGVDLCRALAAVHGAGLLHRDIKAENVMRETGGRIVLMDFGTGHDVEFVPASAGDLSGTPLYLAPELFAGGRPTVTSDVYALAVLLFHMLTGTYPVPGRTLEDVRAGHREGRATRLRGLRPDLSAAFLQAIEHGLAADPSQRFESAGAFETALRQTLTTSAPSTRANVRRWSAWAAVGAGLAATGLVGWLLWGSTPAPTHRRLTPPPLPASWPGHPSSDGRYWPHVAADGSGNNNLWMWEPATDAKRPITRTGTGLSAHESAMSSDGRRVAFSSFQDGGYELLVAGADGSGLRRILPREAADHPVPIEWSRDGAYVLCWLVHKTGHADLALVPSNGGAPRILKVFETTKPRTVRLSHDARFVVYDFPPDPAPAQNDVFIMATDGSPARVLIGGSADDFGPVWTPDGSRVFFLSNRAGSTEGWTLEVADGVSVGEPVRVAQDLGAVSPIALTDDGAYYYSRSSSSRGVYTLQLDLTGAAPPAKAVRVQPGSVVQRHGPSWSPDGKLLSFITAGAQGSTVSIQDMTSGDLRDLTLAPQPLAIGNATRWSPDGSTILIRGADVKGRWGYLAVDVTTGSVTPALFFDEPTNDAAYGAFQWSTDSKSILFRHTPRGIVSRELETGRERVLMDRKANALTRLGPFALSPDGLSLAFCGDRGQETAVMVQKGAEAPRVLQRFGPGETVTCQTWTPDSREFLVTRAPADSPNAVQNPHELWAINAITGEPRDTLIRISGYTRNYLVALSRDGRLAFTLGEQLAELWVLEHFLPKPRSGKRP